jgi:transcriptional regulator with XRE-family HTH domain
MDQPRRPAPHTVRSLAEQVGANRSTISALVTGARETVDETVASRLADALGCALESLFVRVGVDGEDHEGADGTVGVLDGPLLLDADAVSARLGREVSADVLRAAARRREISHTRIGDKLSWTNADLVDLVRHDFCGLLTSMVNRGMSMKPDAEQSAMPSAAHRASRAKDGGHCEHCHATGRQLLLSAEEAAERLGKVVSASWLRRMANEASIPHVRLGRVVCWTEENLLELIRSNYCDPRNYGRKPKRTATRSR